MKTISENILRGELFRLMVGYMSLRPENSCPVPIGRAKLRKWCQHQRNLSAASSARLGATRCRIKIAQKNFLNDDQTYAPALRCLNKNYFYFFEVSRVTAINFRTHITENNWREEFDILVNSNPVSIDARSFELE